MKQTFTYLSLAAGLLLAGCVVQKTENQPVELTFNPVISADTRVDEAVPFPQNRSFNIWAIDSKGKLFLDDMPVANTFGTWNSGENWPDSQLSFIAYWPQDLAPEFSISGGMTIRDFRCVPSVETDILVAECDAEKDNDSAVSLPFEHLLSRVDFRLANSLPEGVETVLKKIEFLGFANVGSWNADGNRTWSVAAADNNYIVYDSAEGMSPEREAKYIGNDFYTIPQPCNSRIRITFDMRLVGESWITDQEMETEAITTVWESGKQYTYTLTIRDQKLSCTTGISNWNNRNSNL